MCQNKGSSNDDPNTNPETGLYQTSIPLFKQVEFSTQ